MTVENPYKSLPVLLLFLSTLIACNGASNEVTFDAPETLVGKDAVIYGNDDRQEVYQHDGDIFLPVSPNTRSKTWQGHGLVARETVCCHVAKCFECHWLLQYSG